MDRKASTTNANAAPPSPKVKVLVELEADAMGSVLLRVGQPCGPDRDDVPATASRSRFSRHERAAKTGIRSSAARPLVGDCYRAVNQIDLWRRSTCHRFAARRVW